MLARLRSVFETRWTVLMKPFLAAPGMAPRGGRRDAHCGAKGKCGVHPENYKVKGGLPEFFVCVEVDLLELLERAVEPVFYPLPIKGELRDFPNLV
jgi:hypothetical protein